ETRMQFNETARGPHRFRGGEVSLAAQYAHRGQCARGQTRMSGCACGRRSGRAAERAQTTKRCHAHKLELVGERFLSGAVLIVRFETRAPGSPRNRASCPTEKARRARRAAIFVGVPESPRKRASCPTEKARRARRAQFLGVFFSRPLPRV